LKVIDLLNSKLDKILNNEILTALEKLNFANNDLIALKLSLNFLSLKTISFVSPNFFRSAKLFKKLQMSGNVCAQKDFEQKLL
jgi:hypothetical protein